MARLPVEEHYAKEPDEKRAKTRERRLKAGGFLKKPGLKDRKGNQTFPSCSNGNGRLLNI